MRFLFRDSLSKARIFRNILRHFPYKEIKHFLMYLTEMRDRFAIFSNQTGLKYLIIVLTMQFLLSLMINPLLNGYNNAVQITCEQNENLEEIHEMQEFLIKEDNSKTVFSKDSIGEFITLPLRLNYMCLIDIQLPPPKTV